MSDASNTNQPERDSMYCHACHHQWQREGESIDCPVCRSSSTEIITSEDDPRHFHGRRPQQTESAASVATPLPDQSASSPSSGPGSPPPANSQTPNAGPTADRNPQGSNSHGSSTIHQFIFIPSVTFFTTFVPHNPPNNAPAQAQPAATPEQPQVTSEQPAPTPQQPSSTPQQPSGTPQQPSHGPQSVTWFGMHFFTPRIHVPPPPPPSGTSSPPTGSTEGATTGQSPPQTQTQPQNGQQQRPGPQTVPGMPGGFMAALLASLFDPTAMMFPHGDAVYSQEAFDRIITQLREANANVGGAPPASQSAIDKLQTKEVDDQMLGTCDGKPKCVICVDEMAKGEKVSILPCNHVFHGECVTPWLKQHNTCPVCRRSIEEELHGKPAKTVEEIRPDQAREHEHHENAPSATGCM